MVGYEYLSYIFNTYMNIQYINIFNISYLSIRKHYFLYAMFQYYIFKILHMNMLLIFANTPPTYLNEYASHI